MSREARGTRSVDSFLRIPREGSPNDPSWITDTIGYVTARQNSDGGYTFSRGTESNAQDTYHALAILSLLKSSFSDAEQTVRWLREFAAYGVHSYYFVTKALRLCGQEPNDGLTEFLRSSEIVFEVINPYVAAASEFETISMFTELVNLSGIKIDRERRVPLLLNCQNVDGGFGSHRHSNLNSTYHAISSLANLGCPIKSLKGTLGFVRSCETPLGGFTIVPNSSPPHMEHTYYGVETLDLLGEQAKYREETAQFVFRCHNANGGFARSETGISTFESTFQALNVLEEIGITLGRCTISSP